MSDVRPIGVFDSGIGGLSVVRELQKQLPGESIVYFGDTARVPYGNKSKETVIRYSMEAVNILLSYNVKAIVVACNTASAHAVNKLKKIIDIPVFGVIQPGVDAALKKSVNKNILVIGTRGTIRSNAYQDRILAAEDRATVSGQACPLFVPLVEEGWLDNEITFLTIEKYLKTYRSNNIDTVILGCTHYPLLKTAIKKYWPEVTLIDSGVETAISMSKYLRENKLNTESKNERKYRFLVSDIAENFKQIGKRFLNSSMDDLEVIDMEKFFVENRAIIDNAIEFE